jgi:hypothetical protein
MRDSGLKMVFLGAESGSAETLESMDKGGRLSPDHTRELVRMMAHHHIVPELSFVVGNPPDPAADTAATMEFIREIKSINPASEIILYLYTPVPLAGSLYDEARAQGFAFPETLDQWVGRDWLEFAQRKSDTMPWLKRSLQQQVLDFERVLNAYYPSITMDSLSGVARTGLRWLAAWRYRSRFYRWPVELGLAQRLVAYQRPETSGF